MEWFNKTFDTTAKKVLAVIAGIVIVVLLIIAIYKSSTSDPFGGTSNTPEPTMKIEEDTDAGQSSDYEGYVDENTGLFANNKTLSCSDVTGGTLTVGLELHGEKSKGLILNPTYSKATPEHKYGYYISSKRLGAIATNRSEYHDVSDPDVAAASDVLIDWTYDRLMPIKYIDTENYGICWTQELNDTTVKDDIIRIAVVDLTTHNIVSSYTVSVARNSNGNFELSDIWNNDLNEIGVDNLRSVWEMKAGASPFEITDLTAKREELLSLAQDIINSGDFIVTEEAFNSNRAVVELTWTTNNIKYLSKEHETAYKGNTTFPVWVVTFNSDYDDIGHITLYFYAETDYCFGVDYIYINTYDELKNYCKDV